MRLEPTVKPAMHCPACGKVMRLVGIERDQENTRRHILTFECDREHLAVMTFPP